LHALDAAQEPADFVFLDPPYRMETAYRETLAQLGPQLLKPAGIVIAEHQKKFDPGESLGSLRRFRLLKQGDAALSFYRVG
jgi:16S rRNA G966 N2-methylase RsmD